MKRRLIRRYDKGWLTLLEVPIDGRPSGRRKVSRQFLDAVVVGMWPSTEYLIHGFEIKASRADIRHELKDLTKSQAGMRECDRFWLVVPSLELLRGGPRAEDLTPSLPSSWGIMTALGPRGQDNGKLWVRRQAQPLDFWDGIKHAERLAKPSRKFVTQMLAKAGSSVLETVELVPTGTPYQQRHKRRKKRVAA